MPATETTEQEALFARASARHVRVTPQKARRVVDMIRGKDTQTAIATLQFAPQGAAEPTLKVLNSAIANGSYLQVLDRWAESDEKIAHSEINPPGLGD